MPTVTIERFAYTPMGVFGKMTWDGGDCYTIEETWRNNVRGDSCIPVGIYEVIRGHYPKHGEAFEVTGVPGRSAILFHVANTVKDIEGCIGPGEILGVVDGLWAVQKSGAAYKRFMDSMIGVDKFMLHIINTDQGRIQ